MLEGVEQRLGRTMKTKAKNGTRESEGETGETRGQGRRASKAASFLFGRAFLQRETAFHADRQATDSGAAVLRQEISVTSQVSVNQLRVLPWHYTVRVQSFSRRSQSRGVTTTGKRPILDTNTSFRSFSHSLGSQPSSNLTSNFCMIPHTTVRISSSARFFPTQFAGPHEKTSKALAL